MKAYTIGIQKNIIKLRLGNFFKKLLFRAEILYHNKHIYGDLLSKIFSIW